MKLYHATTAETAKAILCEQFKNGTGSYLTDSNHTGVWVSDCPLGTNEGAKGNVVLEVTLDVQESELAEYEWIEEGKPYREWLIPEDMLNSRIVALTILEES